MPPWGPLQQSLGQTWALPGWEGSRRGRRIPLKSLIPTNSAVNVGCVSGSTCAQLWFTHTLCIRAICMSAGDVSVWRDGAQVHSFVHTQGCLPKRVLVHFLWPPSWHMSIWDCLHLEPLVRHVCLCKFQYKYLNTRVPAWKGRGVHLFGSKWIRVTICVCNLGAVCLDAHGPMSVSLM